VSLRFSLLGLIGLVTLSSLGCAALVQPGPLWLGVLVTLTACAIAWQTLRALQLAGAARASALGWLVFAVAYLAVALGPWLGRHVGTQLLSTKLLAYAQLNWRQEDPASFSPPVQPITIWSHGWTQAVDGTSSTVFTSTGNSWLPLIVPQPAPGVNVFQVSGHWLFAWMAGWLGSGIALQCWRRPTPK
jgi:hypothetical protein